MLDFGDLAQATLRYQVKSHHEGSHPWAELHFLFSYSDRADPTLSDYARLSREYASGSQPEWRRVERDVTHSLVHPVWDDWSLVLAASSPSEYNPWWHIDDVSLEICTWQ